MKTTARSSIRPPASGSLLRRRGNTLVLTAAILVLLVIIASAYITRTQGEASMSAALMTAAQRDELNQNLADQVSQMLGRQLFGPSIVPTKIAGIPLAPGQVSVPDGTALQPSALPPIVVSANQPLMALDPGAVRYGGGNLRDVQAPLGVPDVPASSNFSYTIAPYTTYPFTNWPDDYSVGGTSPWPPGPGSPNSTVAVNEGNPIGSPGYGDNRILSSFEPYRLSNNSLKIVFDLGGGDISNRFRDRFTHWPHLTNLGRADNNLRICSDISDVANNIVSDLTFPVEQWLPIRYDKATNVLIPGSVPFSVNPTIPAAPNSALVGHGVMSGDNPADFMARWNQWFYNYPAVYRGGGVAPIPSNLYWLADLNGDGILGNFQDQPQDEFVPGTARYTVSRVLVDTDLDGKTDSFWHVAPSTIDRNVMRLIAVRVVDNTNMIDVNVGTRYEKTDILQSTAGSPTPWVNPAFAPRATIAATPSDVPLVGSSADGNFSAWLGGPIPPGGYFATTNVGWFDNPFNSEIGYNVFPVANQGWNNAMWSNTTGAPSWLEEFHLQIGAALLNPAFPSALASQRDRLLFWKSAGLRPLDPPLTFGFQSPPINTGLTPFNLPDEIELRLFSGSNYAWSLSRLEHTLTTNYTNGTDASFLRGNLNAQESTEAQFQTSGAQWLADNRHRMTVYNSTRNDLMPPWLWPALNWTDYLADNNPANGAIDAAEISAAKNEFFRRIRKIDLRQSFVDTDGNGSISSAEQIAQNRDLARRMIDVFEKSLVRDVPGKATETYFGNGAADRVKARNLARSLAAQVICARDTVVNPTLPVGDGPIAPLQIPELADVQDPTRYFIGNEAQPFIMEAFIGHVYGKSRVAQAYLNNGTFPQPANEFVIPPPFDGSGEHFVDDSSTPTTVVCVQLANPYSKPIPLSDFRLRVFGQSFNFAAADPNLVLGPATEERPCTAIVYAIVENFQNDAGNDVQFRTKMQDFLDIQSADLFEDALTAYPDTQVINATKAPASTNGWSVTDVDVYRDDSVESIELLRAMPGVQAVVVDRIDNPNGGGLDHEFRDKVLDLGKQPYAPPPAMFTYDTNSGTGVFAGIRIKTDDYYTVWARTARNWSWDVDGNLRIDPDERNPRYVYSDRPDSDTSQSSYDGYPATNSPDGKYRGDSFRATLNGLGNYVVPPYSGAPELDPDETPWIVRDYIDPFKIARRRKPTFFPTQTVYDVASGLPVYNGFVYANAVPATVRVNFADKSGGLRDPDPQDAASARDSDYYAAQGYDYPFQMAHKDADFDRIGELLNVFLWGPAVKMNGTAPTTEWTFSEILSNKDASKPYPAGKGVMVNRLDVTDQTRVLPNVNGFTPALPAGVLMFDGFVCDNRGIRNTDLDLNGTISPIEADEAELQRYRLANGFTGQGTPGLINLGSSVEVLRAIPFLSRLVHETGLPINNPFVRVPEAIAQYRDRLGAQVVAGANTPFLPGYSDRGDTNGFFPTMRGERGIASLGELLLLKRSSPQADLITNPLQRNATNDSVRIDFAGLDPYFDPGPGAASPPDRGYKVDLSASSDTTLYQARLSTDMIDTVPTPNNNPALPPLLSQPDLVGGDAEERNLIFSSLSNLVTTRSDTFTVYMKIRTFRQNPVTGKWDATDPEHIIDDSRYVMLVDRSNVNSPADKPKVLYLEKLPN